MLEHVTDHVTEQAFEYLSGALEPEALAAFEAHLAGCEACRADIEKKRRFLAHVEHTLNPPRPTDLEVLAAVRAEVARRQAKRSRTPWLWAGLGVALTGAALAAVLLFRSPPPPEKPSVMSAPSDDTNWKPPPPEKGTAMETARCLVGDLAFDIALVSPSGKSEAGDRQLQFNQGGKTTPVYGELRGLSLVPSGAAPSVCDTALAVALPAGNVMLPVRVDGRPWINAVEVRIYDPRERALVDWSLSRDVFTEPLRVQVIPGGLSMYVVMMTPNAGRLEGVVEGWWDVTFDGRKFHWDWNGARH